MRGQEYVQCAAGLEALGLGDHALEGDIVVVVPVDGVQAGRSAARIVRLG
jgi:hypothetical protein